MARAPTIHGPRTFVTVSHDAHAVRSPGDTAVLIDRGEVRASRPANEVVDAYGASSLGEARGVRERVGGHPGRATSPGTDGQFQALEWRVATTPVDIELQACREILESLR